MAFIMRATRGVVYEGRPSGSQTRSESLTCGMVVHFTWTLRRPPARPNPLPPFHIETIYFTGTLILPDTHWSFISDRH